MRNRLFFAMFVWAVVQFAVASASAATPLLVLDGRPLGASSSACWRPACRGLPTERRRRRGCSCSTARTTRRGWPMGRTRCPEPAQTVTLDELLARVKPYLKGQVLYNPRQLFTLDAASTVAGIQGAAVTDKDLGLNTLYDFRTKWNSAEEAYSWMAETLPRQANHHQLALLPADSPMRDYAVGQKMMTLTPGAGFLPARPAPTAAAVRAGLRPFSARTKPPC